MPTLTATDARRDFFEIIKKTRCQHDVFHVQHRQGNVVLMSEEDYEAMIETMQLLSIPNFHSDLLESLNDSKSGNTLSFDDVFGQD